MKLIKPLTILAIGVMFASCGEAKKEEVVEEVVIKFSEMTLFDLEKKHIIDTLDHLNGSKTRAAKALGITVKTLYNKLHSYGLIEARELQ